MIYTDGTHIVADSLQELHDWAKANGISRHWFEGVKKGHPHYDCPKWFKHRWQFVDHRNVGPKIILELSKKMK